MSTDRERLKSKIMAQVERLVEQALAQGEKRLTLSQIEELALTARSGMSQELTSGLLEQQASGTAPELPTCPTCGQRMQPKGQKQRYLRTRSGDVLLHRPYFSCAQCGQGYFPPG
jgi:YgiT-type zinc finger domain-containing protein